MTLENFASRMLVLAMPELRKKKNRIFGRALALPVYALALCLGSNASLLADTQIKAGSQFESLVRKGEAADAQFNPSAALPFYLKALAERPRDVRMLLRVAKEYSDSTLAIPDADEDRSRIEKALEYSNRAAELEPHNAVALLSKAICYGKLGSYSGTREKIEDARLVKQYADEALAEDPDYAYAHHVLGQWEYEVAELGRTKRLLVTLVFGGLPPASTEEAVHQLEIAVRLEPNVSSHRMALGFAYLANGEPAKARLQFKQVIGMPCRELYDADCRRQAEIAIENL
jgi:tetratricopeptide (TPR) repeat protein